VQKLNFRGRLFLILLLFALVPSIVFSFAWAGTSWWVLPLVGGATSAWDNAAASGSRVVALARRGARLSPQDSAVVAEHEQTLQISLTRSKQARFFFQRAAVAIGFFALLSLALLVFVASRVAGHLSRSLSRPLHELVGWTEHIARAEALPESPLKRGAPEFEVLRTRMREMSAALEAGRRTALEAERLSALRESARQVAHELKNPLTPIRFAVERLRRDAPPAMQESVEVLSVESRRLEEMARSFAQFGRLPEGPRAPVDLGELVRYTARSSVPPAVPLEITVGEDVPLIDGHHEALARALSNVMLNAVEACKEGGSISVDVQRISRNGGSAVALSVRDSGCGIPPNRMERIWEPYVTYKPGGTGLGLAIARQTVVAHEGEVAAESHPGKGTVIRFILPVGSGGGGRKV
jgi:two-component system, NtrC family, nitrogen regulation sensor histidine kinase NtrY